MYLIKSSSFSYEFLCFFKTFNVWSGSMFLFGYIFDWYNKVNGDIFHSFSNILIGRLSQKTQNSLDIFILCHFIFDPLIKQQQKFVQGLSILSRGTLEEKLCWTFQLYDINGDGRITKEEMNDIVTAIYNLMGHPTEEKIDEDRIKAKVERIFNVSNFLFVLFAVCYFSMLLFCLL